MASAARARLGVLSAIFLLLAACGEGSTRARAVGGGGGGSASGGASGGTSSGGAHPGGTSSSSGGAASSSSGGGTCQPPAAGSRGTNPLFTDRFTADPAALVDGCTFYVTCGHDEAAPGQSAFVMREWYLLSSNDMVHWTRSAPMSLATFSWADANAWAGQMVKARNGRYYWYVPVQEAATGAMAIGVAVADGPAGPWSDAIGKPLVDDAFEMANMGFRTAAETPYTIDPTVFVDDDGQAYLHYGGFWRMVAAKLNPDMVSIDGRMIESTPPGYWESPYLIKRDGKYYEIYASGSNPGPIDYATSASPMGPWTAGGRVLDPMARAAGETDAPTNHAGVAELAGQWYVVYHVSNGPSGGGTYRRAVAIDKLHFEADGSIRKVTITSGLSFDGSSSSGGGSSSSSGGGSSSSGSSSSSSGAGGSSSSSGGSSSSGAGAGYYTWPAYSPSIAYDYVDEFGTIPQPTRVADDCSGVAGTYTSGWWTFRYGARKNPLVTAAAWVPMLERFNRDFSYITDVMRWPRDGRARSGNSSAIYLYGSGLCTDSASNTEQGGWQGWAGDGPIVLASYYPVYSFDPACTYGDRQAQQGAMIHEGIHAILATMPGVKKACWFQEGGNTWLQATMEMKRSGAVPTEMGWLSAGAAIAPFMPIETYSGWLQDGSFGGPCAERVDKVDVATGRQLCTWRRLLGGTQYGEAFPHALEVILGEKSIAWIWRYAQQSGRVLQDLAEVSGGLGPTQTRRLVQEYRARQAFGDFGIWSTAYESLLDGNWNTPIGADWSPSWMSVETWNATCYVKTTQSGSTLTPEPRTLPGWSGANQIPLRVAPGATSATVTFHPDGQGMSCQLVYRETGGAIRYGTPVSSGACSIPVADVKNGVVVAVIANTDYVYDGGTKKYGYTLTLGQGVSGTADIYGQWYR